MKDIVFCTMITENYKNSKVEFDLFYKSFTTFNPGAELVVSEDSDIKRIFEKNPSASFTNWKTSLAKELYKEYKTVDKLFKEINSIDRHPNITIKITAPSKIIFNNEN